MYNLENVQTIKYILFKKILIVLNQMMFDPRDSNQLIIVHIYIMHMYKCHIRVNVFLILLAVLEI